MLSIVKTVFKILAHIFLFCGILFSGAGICLSVEMENGKGVVNSGSLNVRAKASNDSKVIGVLKKGEVVSVIESHGGSGGWLEIDSRSVHGFVRNRPKYILLQEKEKEISQDQTGGKRKAETIRQKLIDKESEVQEFTEKEIAMIDGLNEIELAMNRMRLRISELTGELDSIDDKIVAVARKKEDLAVAIDKNRDYAGARLNALYRLKMIGEMDLVSTPLSMFDFFLQQNALKRILASDLLLLDRQVEDMNSLATVSTDLENLGVEKRELDLALKEEMRLNRMENQKRSSILRDIKKKKELGLAAVDSLRRAAKELETKITAFEPGSFDSGKSFSRLQGFLPMPVQGKIITRYGSSKNSDYSSFTFQTGVGIRVKIGEPVHSVFKGSVLYAQWLNGYGNLIIVNHGDNFYTLYAHVEKFLKKEGEMVDTGEVIALAGDTGSIKGPYLHFEVRHHGKPVDPMKWLKKGA